MQENDVRRYPFYALIILILAGEAVFILPFVLARIFRPTFLDIYQLSNLQLGYCFSVYGIVALVAYLFGGVIADLWKPRILIAVSLILTAFGGFYMSTIPSYIGMKILFGYFGFTTIFLFWSAMIKATRIWGDTDNQGKAFGFLDGGRGIVAASFGMLGVFIFSLLIEGNIELAEFSDRKYALQTVVVSSSIIVIIVAILVLLGLKSFDNSDAKESDKFQWSGIIEAIKIPSIWLLMIIILCAYVGYKLTDEFSLYAKEVMLYNEIKSAKIGIFLLYLRPIVGFSIGYIADKTKSSLWLIIGFAVMILGSVLFASGIMEPNMTLPFLLSVFITGIGIYAIRTLYFAAMQEGNIPLALTGTAVGLMSFIGYTPDIFVGPVMGYLLDSSPGETGHQHVFMMLGIFSFIGFVFSCIFWKVNSKQSSTN